MHSNNLTEYYRNREQNSQALAQGAFSDGIKAIHLEMAAQYARLASEMSPGNRTR